MIDRINQLHHVYAHHQANRYQLTSIDKSCNFNLSWNQEVILQPSIIHVPFYRFRGRPSKALAQELL